MTVSDVDAGTAAPPMLPGRPSAVGRVVAIVVLAVVALVVRSCTSDDGGASNAAGTTLDPATQAAIDTAVSKAIAAQGLPVSEIYSRIAPSVVEVDVDPGGRRRGRPAGLGTGVIVNGDGTILTANHVVDGATTIEVVYADGTRSDADSSAADPRADIATLAPATLPSVVVPAVLGAPGASATPVVAVGNPFGLDDTTTAGVISGARPHDRGRTARPATA